MEIDSLGYIGFSTAHLDEWSDFASGLIGMQQVEKTNASRAFRMDDRKQRVVLTSGNEERLTFIGWEARSSEALTALADRLEGAGIPVSEGSRDLAAERWVERLIVFRDPAGNRLEAFCHAQKASDPFKPGRPITGFRTGALGMGHIVLDVTDIESLLPFYRDLLGFRISDFGVKPYKLYFFHLNERHHSFAMIEGGGNKVHHLMVEVTHIDDVGQGYDLATLEERRLAYTLGRHTNDHIISFYAHTPSKFFIEYGWGGRSIDPATWVPHETFNGPSFWGHDRLYMADEPRQRLREMRLQAATNGLRAPVAPDCLWSEALIRQE